MTRHVHQLLSAYVDGEAQRPDRIAAHLSACEECARHHRELLALSQRMQALPFPEVRPEFTTRVIAHVRDADPVPRRAARRWLSVSLAGASIAAVLAIVWIFQTDAYRGFDATNEPAGRDTWTSAMSSNGGGSTDAWTNDNGIDSEEWPVEVVEPLGNVLDTPLVEAWGPPEDLDALLLRLDDDEQEDFRALLWLYAQESDVI